MTAPGSSTCYMEQRSSDHIIADVNEDNIAKGHCHHFSIREYVRQMQMSNSMFCSLSGEHINSSLVTTKIYRQWNCKGCWDKLEPLYNTTPARTLNEFAQVPEHTVRKELSQEKSSANCHSPSSYSNESTEVDRAINDFDESTPINQENGSAKYLSPSWGSEESADANPIVNGTGLDDASPSNPDGTKKTPSNVDFMDDTNPPDTCQNIKDKKEINKEKLEFLHGEPMLERCKKGNKVKSLPVKRKDETHASLHNIDKNIFKTYKRRKNTKVHDFINESFFVDSQNRSESNRAGNSKEKHVLSIMQPDGSLLRPGVCLSEGKIPHTTNIMDGDESIGVYQTPCSSENELECSMYLSEVSPGKSEQTHRKTTEDAEDERAIISVKGASTKVQSEKSNPEFSQLEQQQSQHLHNELPQSITEDEKDDCVITSVKEVSTRLQSGKLQNHLSKEESQIPHFMWSQHQQFQHLHNEVPLGNATEDEYDVSTRLQSGESHNQYNGENFTPYSDSTNLNGSFAPIMDISGKYQHPQNFSKPFRPVPRIGVLSLTLQKEVTTYSESCGTQSGYRLGMSEEETPCQMYRGENSSSNSQEFLENCSPQHLGYVTPVSIPEAERGSSHSTKGKSKIVDQPSEEDICALSLSLPRRP
ncbi:unnamed protein product [Alopecurus aequalis]